MCCRYIYMKCLWCLLWTMCDAYNVYLSGVRYTSSDHKNRKYMVTLPSVTLDKEAFCRVPRLKHECYTWQRGILLSARVKTLGKVDTWQNFVHSRTKMASLSSVCAMTLGKEAKILCILGLKWLLCRVFAGCLVFDTRQRTKVCRVPGIWYTAKDEDLPSAWNLTHGKGRSFAECLNFDTRQRRKVCRVPDIWHSANAPWPCPLRHVTFFCRASVSALGKVFAECPIENTRQRAVCRHCRCRVPFAECYAWQILCWVFFGLCRVPVAHGKTTVSSSVGSVPL